MYISAQFVRRNRWGRGVERKEDCWEKGFLQFVRRAFLHTWNSHSLNTMSFSYVCLFLIESEYAICINGVPFSRSLP